MSKLKSILKWFFIIIILLGVALFAYVKIVSEDLPTPNNNENADLLAESMLTALNKPAWDTLKYLKWEFPGGHKYLWDKQGNMAAIDWGSNRVIMDLDQVDGKAYADGEEVTGEKKTKLIQEAWKIWCNDSFWMFAPFKVFDPGTNRYVVDLDGGGKGLLISYESGGVTPGDSYLWQLDENNIPTGYKMWTSIIPLKGMEISWENWKTLDGGAMVALAHKSKLFSFDMEGVKEGSSPSEMGYEDSIFKK